MTKSLSRAKLPKEVRDLIATVRSGLRALDDAMKGPSTRERGETVARVLNVMEMAVDHLDHFGIKERRPREQKALSDERPEVQRAHLFAEGITQHMRGPGYGDPEPSA